MLLIYYKNVTLCYGDIVAKRTFFVKKICMENCEFFAGFSFLRHNYVIQPVGSNAIIGK